jgi:hypothetical protein
MALWKTDPTFDPSLASPARRRQRSINLDRILAMALVAAGALTLFSGAA